MTYSIVAQSGEGFGVAVASRFFAVGSVVPAIRVGVGALATQSLANARWRRRALDLLEDGLAPQEVLDVLVAEDPRAPDRQIGLVGPEQAACFTGSRCQEWAGHLRGRDDSGSYAIQGNIIVGEEVLDEMERAWLSGVHLPLPSRLLLTLNAGERAGGDRRGRQSAAVYALAPGAGYGHSDVMVDLRVDDHPDPLEELGRLLDLHELYQSGPTNVLPLEGPLAQEVRERLELTGRTQEELHAALAHWAGEENLEMRLSPDGIDSRVLQILREQTTETTFGSTGSIPVRSPMPPSSSVHPGPRG